MYHSRYKKLVYNNVCVSNSVVYNSGTGLKSIHPETDGQSQCIGRVVIRLVNINWEWVCPPWLIVLRTIMSLSHWKHSLKRNRQEDCHYVYDEVLYISSWLHQESIRAHFPPIWVCNTDHMCPNCIVWWLGRIPQSWMYCYLIRAHMFHVNTKVEFRNRSQIEIQTVEFNSICKLSRVQLLSQVQPISNLVGFNRLWIEEVSNWTWPKSCT